MAEIRKPRREEESPSRDQEQGEISGYGQEAHESLNEKTGDRSCQDKEQQKEEKSLAQGYEEKVTSKKSHDSSDEEIGEAFSRAKRRKREKILLPRVSEEAGTTSNEEPHDSSETRQKFNRLPEYIKRCFLYTCLFPKDYEFEEKILLQLWAAVDFFSLRDKRPKDLPPLPTGATPEDEGRFCFRQLLFGLLFEKSSLAYPNGVPRYKVHHTFFDLLQQEYWKNDEYARVKDRKPTAQTLHSSLLMSDGINPTVFEDFYQSKNLCTLLLLNEEYRRSPIKQVPSDLFLNLTSLLALDLSRTCIAELPDSIENLKNLRYFNVSETPIRNLPESICSLTHLLTLKEGFRIQELKDLDELRGSLVLSNLENVREESEATDARLNFKKFLRKVEFQWSRLESKAEKTLEKLLPPHQFLSELKILYYGGAKFPSWLGMSKFSSLATISLTNCRKCTQLPTLGKLPWLKSLKLEELHAIEEINHDVFCGHGEFEGFPKLESLEIDGMRRLERWTGMVEGQMPLLCRLIIIDCPSLTFLPELLYLHSLQHLKISHCSKLLSLPEEGLPKLVQLLIIMECPELENRCKMGGYNWHKIEHIPNKWIGYGRISGTKPLEQCIADLNSIKRVEGSTTTRIEGMFPTAKGVQITKAEFVHHSDDDDYG